MMAEGDHLEALPRVTQEQTYRVLIVDDNPAIHEDFRRVFDDADLRRRALDELTFSVLGSEPAATATGPAFVLDFARQGQRALAMVTAARESNDPYALVFMDIQMPPGWNGVDSTRRIIASDPDVHVVLCTAHTDAKAQQQVVALPARDRVLILKKPFDTLEVQQLARALCEKWTLGLRDKARMAELEQSVSEHRGKLAATCAHLRQEIAERARAQSELRKAQRLESLGRLAAGLCHEINNPLSFILGNIELMQEDLPGLEPYLPRPMHEELQELSRSVCIGASRIAKLVRNIKLFARQSEAPTEVIALREAVESAAQMARLPQQPRLQMVITVGEQRVIGRRVELEQVLINLLQNAWHAMATQRDRPARLELGVQRSDDRMVAVYVSDTGPGIDPAIIDKIFDPFFTTKAIDEGTGLGLSICHSLVRSMGGTIDVQSTRGQGTTFTLRLPEATTHRPGSETDPPRSAPREPSQSGRILVIDDEPFILRIIERILRHYPVTCVPNAQEGLERCTREHFDVILCDIMMPGTSGCDFHRQLGQLAPGVEERIVFLTGGSRIDSVRRFIDQIPNRCMEKPFKAAELRALVDEMLGRRTRPGR
ncbi:MAG: response regulator [Myxococcota bacterium]